MRRMLFVFVRWLAVVMATYVAVAGYLLVVVYIGVSIFAEIAPDRFLRVMPGGALGRGAERK